MFKSISGISYSLNSVSYLSSNNEECRFADFREYYAHLKDGKRISIDERTFRFLRGLGK